MGKSTNNQTEANKRWRAKNRDRALYLSKRSTCRSFIRNNATLDDLAEIDNLVDERELYLKQKENN